MNGSGMLPDSAEFAVAVGRNVNSQGRMYTVGAPYSMDLKVEVAHTYILLARQSATGRPKLSQIASRHEVDSSFVKKIESELWCHGRVLSPQECRANEDRPVGPGSISLCQTEMYIIIRLYYENPSRHLRDYRDHIMLITGNQVSIDTISRVLLHGFPFKGSLVKTNLLPIDKFKPENEVRAFEYLEVLFYLHPYKVIFVDEKHLRGEDYYSRLVRKSPLDGTAPAIVVPSDFRNTWTITGFCSIDHITKRRATWSRLLAYTNNADEFYRTCQLAGQDGYFQPHDVVVADNATIHNGVQKMMWECYRVLVLFLPTRTCEWNPQELVWQTMLTRMNNVPLKALRETYGYSPGIVAKCAMLQLSKTTFNEVKEYYSKCYSFIAHWRRLSRKHG